MYVHDTDADDADRVRLHVEQFVLDDLQHRLRHTRWPSTVATDAWQLGTSSDYLRELIAYWANDYDWRHQEQWLNGFSHYRSVVDGLKIHYVHQRSSDASAIPLLLLHGWPGSFVQMLRLLPLLTNPAAHGLAGAPSFHVVIASLPGFGFSDAPSKPGMNLEVIAGCMTKLMCDVLGYQRFGARGSDLGGVTIDQIARHHAQHVLGAHLTQIIVSYGPPVPDDATDAEKEFLARSAALAQTEISYARQHMQKPLSLSYGLADSPAGLAGWIIEKYRSWGDTGGNIESRFDKDFLITTLMTYWLSNNSAPSVRTYYEMARNRGSTARITVPTAFLMSQRDLFPPAPREWAQRSHNVVHFSETSTGGHFLEWEEPLLVARDLQQFFGTIGQSKATNHQQHERPR